MLQELGLKKSQMLNRKIVIVEHGSCKNVISYSCIIGQKKIQQGGATEEALYKFLTQNLKLFHKIKLYKRYTSLLLKVTVYLLG